MSNNNTRILSEPITYQELLSIKDLKITGIYKIENLINHKVYIGKSKNIIGRLKDHIKNEQNIHLRSSFEKYGFDNFSFEVIKQTYDLNYWEIFLIQIYNATDDRYGYNIATGGEGGNLGPKVNNRISESLMKSEKYRQSLKSPERSAKISYAAKHRSPETLYAIGSANRGKKISEEIKQKQSVAQKNSVRKREVMQSAEYREKIRQSKLGEKNPNYGKHLTEEEKRIRSEKLKGRIPSETHRKHLSESLKGRKNGPLSKETKIKLSKRFKGMVYWNNGVSEIRSHTCPEGFVRGRLPREFSEEFKIACGNRFRGKPKSEETRRKMSESAKRRRVNGNPNFEQAMENRRGEHHYNNSIINICAKECPPGFVPGMIKKKS